MNNDFETILRNFFAKYRKLEYKKGEIIYRPGDTFDQIGFIDAGYVRCYRISENGKEVTITFFKPVFYLSLMGALNNTENKYFFECMTDVTLWKAPKNDLIELLNGNSNLSMWVTARVLKALDDSLTSNETKAEDSYNKVAAIIYSMARSLNNNSELEFSSSHRIIASLVGTTRETASIQIKKLERAGFISQNKGLIKISDPEKYKQEFHLE